MRFVAAILLTALVLPELPRYQGERRLRGLTGVLTLWMRTAPPDRRSAALHGVSLEAEATHTHPGDWRPWMTAANASLLANDSARAAALLERALREGERPEVVANLGIALAAQGEEGRARQALLRAAWVSPGLIPVLEKRTGVKLGEEIAQRERNWDIPPPLANGSGMRR